MAKTIKNKFLSEVSSYPIDIWTPENDKKIRIHGISLHISNNTTGLVRLKLQIKIDGSNKSIAIIGVRDSNCKEFIVPIATDFDTDIGDGIASAIKVDKMSNTTSTDYDAFIAIIGEEL